MSFSLNREQSAAVRPPRSLVARFPFGRPLGAPGAVEQQRQLLFDAFRLALTATEPGVIVELPYKWRRHEYRAVDFGELSA